MDPRIQMVIDLLRADLNQDFSLAGLADLAGLSKSHFSQLFKTHAGLPPKQYFLRLKLERASELLADSAKSVEAIMREAGFRDKSEFARQFRRAYAVSASKYRKQIIKAAARAC